MNSYKVEFIVNGKINPHGLIVSADCFNCAVISAFQMLHSVYDGFDFQFEVLSVSLFKCS